MTDVPVTAKQAASEASLSPKALEADQEAKDIALAKSLKRQPLERHPGESDFLYTRRLSRTLTEAQIALAHDMHAIHEASAAGYVLPPLPVSPEQKAADDARAKELGVKPLEREPGESDAAYDARLALSPPMDAKEPTPVALAGPLGDPAPIVPPPPPNPVSAANDKAEGRLPAHAFGGA